MKMFQFVVSVIVMVFLSGCLPDMQLPDNNAATEQWWWQDADGDGYGDEDLVNDGVYGLKPGANWAANPLDCDDSAAAIYPNRAEARNGLDDDCDGRFDEHWMYVFVTAPMDGSIYDDGIGLGGPETNYGPDGYCNANKGTLPGRYEAWVARAGLSPADRFIQPPAEVSYDYILVDGTVVANDWADLTDGSLDVPINKMLDGTTYTGYIWTSVKANGTYDTSNDNDQFLYGHCNFWQRDSGQYAVGRIGHTGYTDSQWTEQNQFMACSNQYPIVCVRQWEP